MDERRVLLQMVVHGLVHQHLEDPIPSEVRNAFRPEVLLFSACPSSTQFPCSIYSCQLSHGRSWPMREDLVPGHDEVM
jgi:hypothetical protein